MANNNTCAVITDSDIIYYYTGQIVEDSYLVIIDNKKYLFTDKRYYYGVTQNGFTKLLLTCENDVVTFIKSKNIASVYLVYEYTSLLTYKLFTDNNFSVFDYTSEFVNKSVVKNQIEIAKIKKSCQVCEKAFLESIPEIKEGITELELSAILEYNFKKLGASKPSFDTIVAFGKGSAIPHYKTSNVRLEKNTPILMDFGCYVGGYASDMTRTLYFGTPSDKFLSVYDIVLKAHQNAFENIRAGITCIDADNFARKVIVNGGYGEYFTHSLGHGVGVKIHEAPRLSPKGMGILQNGNVFTIEPGIYLNNEFGVRIENTVYLENDKCKSMMQSKLSLITL